MPLEIIELRNFQAHRRLSIALIPGVTTIVGATDRGKSAILRALRWLCLNKPAGDEFKQFGRKFVSVILHVDGHKIRRKRGSENLYELDGKKLVAFGAGVPPEIADLLNVGDVNFQGQLDGPYWLSDSPGIVAKKLNAVVDLGVIDKSLASIGATVRKEAGAVELTRERLASAKKRLESLSWVPEFDADLGKLEKKASRIASERAQISDMASAAARLRNCIQLKRGAFPAVQDCREVLRMGATAARVRKELRDMTDAGIRLSGLIKSWEQAKDALEHAKLKLKRLRPAEKCPTCGQTIPT